MALTDFEAIIKTYIEERLKESYPEIGMSGEVLSDLYINPLVEMSKPLILWLNKVDRMQSLFNYDYMTNRELDIIGEGNYGVTRMPGSRASGYVFVEVEARYATDIDIVTIPVISVESNNGLRFRSRIETIIKSEEDTVVGISGTVVPGVVSDYLNVSTGKYEFPVFVEAEDIGDAYNVEENALNKFSMDYPFLTGVVTNREAINNGSAFESNAEYVSRIRQEPVARAVGTATWYKNYILKNFPSACDVYVAGYGDPTMDRDRVVFIEGSNFVEKNIGGKVDIYITGSDIQEYSQTSYIYSDRVRLENPHIVDEGSVIVNNMTNPNRNNFGIELLYEFPEEKRGYLDVKVSSFDPNLLPDDGDELEVRYISYLDDTNDTTYIYLQRFYYNSNRIRLSGLPFKGIVSIINDTSEKTIDLNAPSEPFSIVRVLPVSNISVCPSQDECGAAEVKLSILDAIPIANYYLGDDIVIIDGSGAGQTRRITEFSSTTLIATVDSAWDNPPSEGSTYRIVCRTNKAENSAKDTIDIILDMSSFSPGMSEPNFSPDDLITLNYTYNKLVADLQFDNDVKEIRAIGADVLAREGTPNYIYFAFKIKCKYGRRLTNDQKLIMQSVIEQDMLSHVFNSEIQLSDLISELYLTPEVEAFMDYIIMPPVFFSSPEIESFTDEELSSLTGPDYCMSNIVFSGVDFPVLARCVINDAD